jgi:hypothetical protein
MAKMVPGNSPAKKQVWILLGQDMMRKTSVISCLTGIGGRPRFHVHTRDLCLAPFGKPLAVAEYQIWTDAIQEFVGSNRIAPNQLVAEILASNSNRFLLPLHDSGHPPGRTGKDYVDALTQTPGISVAAIALFGLRPTQLNPANWVAGLNIPQHVFPNSGVDPCTQTAAALRPLFGLA